MEITVGPNQFFWKPEVWSAFYDDLADAPVSRVTLGELVCSKRLPFYQDRIEYAVEAIANAGKTPVLTSLALVTLKRERKMTDALADLGLEVEINDLTALTAIPKGTAFSVGPLVNVYNEGTLDWLAKRGATRVCLPPELPLSSIAALAKAGQDMGVTIEVWGYGRVPLAISGRCYHARLHGRIKDNCQFACEDDPDGLQVDTLDGQRFLAMNGVQTLSDTYACVDHQIEALRDAGVSALRLSPQTGDFVGVCRQFRDRIDGLSGAGDVAAAIIAQTPDVILSDGFLDGATGASWSHE